MKKTLFVILLLAPVLCCAAKVQKSAEYTVAVHVYSSSLVSICNNTMGSPGCKLRQHLNVVIDGKKYEMNSKDFADGALRTGDYKAMLLPEEAPDGDNPSAGCEYRQRYEFLFPGGKTRKYLVVGGSE